MPTLLFQFITVSSNLIIFIFLLAYLLQIRAKEKEIEKKEKKIDTNYHQVVDNALFKERRILEDATEEAEQIITGAQYSTQAAKDAIHKALQTMLAEVQKDAVETAKDFMNDYQASLKQLSKESMNEFQNVARGLQTNLQRQVEEFHSTLLPNLQKELDAYKQTRLAQTDQMVTRVIQKVAQEVLNKTISLDDHHALMIDSLEKAKKQGTFE